MKYFLDTEFHEYQKKPLFGKPIDTVELISIGIVSEDTITSINYPNNIMNIGVTNNKVFGDSNDSSNWKKWEYNLPTANYSIKSNKDNTVELNTSKEYYAICKDFDLKAAWKNEWLRENVLQPMCIEYLVEPASKYVSFELTDTSKITYTNFKQVINKYGKTRKQIAEKIKEFIGVQYECDKFGDIGDEIYTEEDIFYGYYNSTDWVLFYRLFNTKMLNMPKRIHWCCRDLKQMLDEKYPGGTYQIPDETGRRSIKDHPSYPKQTNEHNALADAKWNKELYKFLETL